MYRYKSLQVCQLPHEHLLLFQNSLNFIITKYLKQEVNDKLSLCMVESSPCGLYKDLSMSRDEKVMTLLWRSALQTSVTELLLLPKFPNSSPSVTRDKEICHLKRSTQWNPFNDAYLLSKLDVSSFFVTGDTQIFEQVKVDVHFSNFGHVKTDPVCSVLLLWTCHSYFTEFG